MSDQDVRLIRTFFKYYFKKSAKTTITQVCPGRGDNCFIETKWKRQRISGGNCLAGYYK